MVKRAATMAAAEQPARLSGIQRTDRTERPIVVRHGGWGLPPVQISEQAVDSPPDLFSSSRFGCCSADA